MYQGPRGFVSGLFVGEASQFQGERLLGCLLGWLAGCLVAWLVGWLVGCDRGSKGRWQNVVCLRGEIKDAGRT